MPIRGFGIPIAQLSALCFRCRAYSPLSFNRVTGYRKAPLTIALNDFTFLKTNHPHSKLPNNLVCMTA